MIPPPKYNDGGNNQQLISVITKHSTSGAPNIAGTNQVFSYPNRIGITMKTWAVTITL